jgi:hypothetical protein
VPWAIVNASYKKQRLNPGVTEVARVANRGHALTIDSGWREIADQALAFVQRFPSVIGRSTSLMRSRRRQSYPPCARWRPRMSTTWCFSSGETYASFRPLSKGSARKQNRQARPAQPALDASRDTRTTNRDHQRHDYGVWGAFIRISPLSSKNALNYRRRFYRAHRVLSVTGCAAIGSSPTLSRTRGMTWVP